MKNYEKYAEEIKKFDGNNFCRDFIRPNILKIESDESKCDYRDCSHCAMLQLIWLLEEYEEPEVDWSKVEVDTPILVKEKFDSVWTRRYFAGHDDGIVYAWANGRTSWNETETFSWEYAKLAEKEGVE